MVASCIYILDLKGKVLISRNYRGDIPPTAVDKFMTLLLEEEEAGGDSGCASPILTDEGINFLYIKHNNVYRTLVSAVWLVDRPSSTPRSACPDEKEFQCCYHLHLLAQADGGISVVVYESSHSQIGFHGILQGARGRINPR